jgi:two-component system cell cycle sensor histidine kinase/response regulator CckA
MHTPVDSHQQQKLLALGQLAGGVAHNFNNILSIIEGYTRILQRELGGNPDIVEKLHNISLATQRGGALTRQMLVFGRQHVGPGKACDLVGALNDSTTLLRPLLGPHISLGLYAPATPVFIPCDSDMLAQMVMNLVTNARDALVESGSPTPTVRLDVAATDTRVFAFVTDNGTGIPAHILPHIFDPFFTTKDQGKGTGLGLSMVAGLMHQIGGAITVESTLGTGTCFTLDFPRASPMSLITPQQQTRPDTLTQKTILIVDDEESLLSIIEDDLQHMGLRVLKAANAANALVLQQQYKDSIDLLLTDVVMPGITGVQLAEKFSEFRPDTGIVFMTGYPFRGEAAPGGGARMPDNALVLPKPFHTSGLSDALQKALDRVGRTRTQL